MKVNYYQGHSGLYELRSTSAAGSTQNTNTKWNLINGETNKTIAQSLNRWGPCLENRTNRLVALHIM